MIAVILFLESEKGGVINHGNHDKNNLESATKTKGIFRVLLSGPLLLYQLKGASPVSH